MKERGSHLEDIVGLLTLKTWSPWIRIVSKHKRGTAQDRKEVIEQFENRNIKVCGWPRKCARSFMKDMLGVQCLPGAQACSQFKDELKGFSLGLLSFVFQESSLHPFLIPPAHPSSVILLVCWTTLLTKGVHQYIYTKEQKLLSTYPVNRLLNEGDRDCQNGQKNECE